MFKEATFDRSFGEITTPVQIFLSNPQVKVLFLLLILQLSQNMGPNTKLFVHAPYIINLCSDDSWPVERLRHELLACQQLGGKGVVVHTGKYKDQDIEIALNKMEASIRKVLDLATEQCPLLIETPAGEGTELCSGLTRFQSFYDRFSGTPNLKICIDSAHVWGASYDPEYYLNSWLTKRPGSIALVHFNDSGVCRGSRVDRHHQPGLGYIGYNRLWLFMKYVVKIILPMVQRIIIKSYFFVFYKKIIVDITKTINSIFLFTTFQKF